MSFDWTVVSRIPVPYQMFVERRLHWAEHVLDTDVNHLRQKLKILFVQKLLYWDIPQGLKRWSETLMFLPDSVILIAKR